MALVSIDPKALEHACLSAGRSVHHFDRMGDDLPLRASIVAHARAIERLEAFKREVSEICRHLPNRPFVLDRFILPAPDPLVEAEKLISTLRSDERDGYAVAGKAAETISNLVAALRAQQKDTNA